MADERSGVAATATTLTVCPEGCDFTSIQAAIDAAQPGDTIEVDARGGPYRETLEIATSGILLRSVHGTAVLDGGGDDGAPLAMVTIRADEVGVSGFTLESGVAGFLLDKANRWGRSGHSRMGG